jgi:hypothetical protein
LEVNDEPAGERSAGFLRPPPGAPGKAAGQAERARKLKNKIAAVTVNHNTSLYMELMLRSLFAHHTQDLDLSLTVYDNTSTDDRSMLLAYTQSQNLELVQTGFTTQTQNNSHGEILGRFVLDHPDCTHYLFLDSDVCFLEDNTLNTMLDELEGNPEAFGIGPRMSWDGVVEIPIEARRENPDICDLRLHPCCALVKNTPLFRTVVEEIGLSSAKILWGEREEIADTFKLMTKVMRTHGLKHIFSSKMVLHFFCVSYIWEPTRHWNEAKARRRDDLLGKYRHA